MQIQIAYQCFFFFYIYIIILYSIIKVIVNILTENYIYNNYKKCYQN